MTEGQKRLVVLLGYPLGHTLSPSIHNASFAAQRLRFRYEARPVAPSNLKAEIQRLKDAGFAGANVTVPHKRAVLDFVDTVSPTVEAVGAANTLVWKHDERILFADNTDVGGFLATLDGSRFLTRPCVILGTGGAARAVAYGMAALTDSPHITVAGRSLEKARELVASLPRNLGAKLRPATIIGSGSAVRQAGLVINATTVGMAPNVDESPLPESLSLRPGQVAYDLVYNPAETRFMREARELGAESIGGLEMLLQQAALSYRMWTRKEMDLDSARAALNT